MVDARDRLEKGWFNVAGKACNFELGTGFLRVNHLFRGAAGKLWHASGVPTNYRDRPVVFAMLRRPAGF
ncbi:MAG TPA: hypothetical protein VGO56_18850 [Pyrinomonadaceae bacterium]|nr:hypothetical protein [Pyrinomonadaceae bacterium]